MTFKRDADLSHWQNDPLKKIIILKKHVVDGTKIDSFEIRQYTHHCSSQRYHTIYTIYMETDNNKIETKYNVGIQMNDDNNIENMAQCITNFNGVYSTINRLLIELDNPY
jgi:hypothetical protein